MESARTDQGMGPGAAEPGLPVRPENAACRAYGNSFAQLSACERTTKARLADDSAGRSLRPTARASSQSLVICALGAFTLAKRCSRGIGGCRMTSICSK